MLKLWMQVVRPLQNLAPTWKELGEAMAAKRKAVGTKAGTPIDIRLRVV